MLNTCFIGLIMKHLPSFCVWAFAMQNTCHYIYNTSAIEDENLLEINLHFIFFNSSQVVNVRIWDEECWLLQVWVVLQVQLVVLVQFRTRPMTDWIVIKHCWCMHGKPVIWIEGTVVRAPDQTCNCKSMEGKHSIICECEPDQHYFIALAYHHQIFHGRLQQYRPSNHQFDFVFEAAVWSWKKMNL